MYMGFFLNLVLWGPKLSHVGGVYGRGGGVVEPSL